MNVLLRKTPSFRNFVNCKFCTKVCQEGKEKWDLLSAVSLERIPIVARELNELESKVSKVLAEIEYENSYKSNFEKRLEEDKIRAKNVKEGNISLEEIDSAPQQTGEDFLDVGLEELNSFKFGDRTNKSDNDLKSTKRLMDRRLLLLVRQQIGQKQLWVLPQGLRKEKESSLRETAERVLKEQCGDTINVEFLGNAPCGFYKYKYPRAQRQDSVGAKIFFFKAQLKNGNVDDKMCKDFHWATRKEMEILQESYKKSIDLFLIDEEH